MMYLGNQAVGLATSLPEFADIAKIECGSYTPTVDQIASETPINHSLGAVPDFIIFFCQGFVLSAEETTTYLIGGSCYILNTSFNGIRHVLATIQDNRNIGTYVSVKVPSNYATSSSFTIPYNTSTDKLKANMTYYYVIGKLKEVTPNA